MPLAIVDALGRFVWNRGKDVARCGQAFAMPGGEWQTNRLMEMRRETRAAIWLSRDAQVHHQLQVLEPCVQLGELAFQAQPVANLQLIGRSA